MEYNNEHFMIKLKTSPLRVLRNTQRDAGVLLYVSRGILNPQNKGSVRNPWSDPIVSRKQQICSHMIPLYFGVEKLKIRAAMASKPSLEQRNFIPMLLVIWILLNVTYASRISMRYTKTATNQHDSYGPRRFYVWLNPVRNYSLFNRPVINNTTYCYGTVCVAEQFSSHLRNG
jgi:hypothetical protein